MPTDSGVPAYVPIAASTATKTSYNRGKFTVEGSYLKRQLDAALDGAKDSPTRLMRNLIGTFLLQMFNLAVSSVYGTGRLVALDSHILHICIC